MAVRIQQIKTLNNTATPVQSTGSAANGSWGCNGGGWLCSKSKTKK